MYFNLKYTLYFDFKLSEFRLQISLISIQNSLDLKAKSMLFHSLARLIKKSVKKAYAQSRWNSPIRFCRNKEKRGNVMPGWRGYYFTVACYRFLNRRHLWFSPFQETYSHISHTSQYGRWKPNCEYHSENKFALWQTPESTASRTSSRSRRGDSRSSTVALPTNLCYT